MIPNREDVCLCGLKRSDASLVGWPGENGDCSGVRPVFGLVCRVRPFLENSTACTMFNAKLLNPDLTFVGGGFL